MHSKLKIVFYLLIIGFTSCSPIYYAPAPQNIPLFEKKGEGRVAAGISLVRSEIDLQAAYALSDHTGLMLNFSSMSGKHDSLDNKVKGDMLEFGVGRFYKLDWGLIFEVYAFVTTGKINEHFSKQGDLQADLFRIGVQPAIGFRHENFEVALSTRLGSLNYQNPKGDLFFDGYDQVKYLKENPYYVLIEPALTWKYGFKNIKIFSQVQISQTMPANALRQQRLSLNGGIIYGFGNKSQ